MPRPVVNKGTIDVIYARTSKDKDDGNGVESQVEACLRYYKPRFGDMPPENILREEHTGFDMSRPVIDQLRVLIKQGRIRRIIVHAVDRLARRSVYAKIILEDELFPAGIELHVIQGFGRAVENTTADTMLFSVLAEMAQFEGRTIKERLVRGREFKRNAGAWVGEGRDKFGYGRRGTKKQMEFFVVEEQANVVRRIFFLFVVEQRSVAYIARVLAAEGIPTPSQLTNHWKLRKTWSDSMVYTILRESKYVGRFIAQRFESVITRTGKEGTVRDNSREIAMTLEHLRIVDDELFYRAQAILDANRSRYLPTGETFYLMSTRTWCDECAKMNNPGVSPKDRTYTYKANASTTRKQTNDGLTLYRYYRCNSRTEQRRNVDRTACNLRQIPADPVDEIVWNWCIKLLHEPKEMIEGFEQARIAASTQNLDKFAVLESIKRQYAAYKEELESILKHESNYRHTRELYERETARLNNALDNCAIELERAEADLQHVLSASEMHERVTALIALRDVIDRLDVIDDRMRLQIVNLLDVRAQLGRNPKNDRPYVRVVWFGSIMGTVYVDVQPQQDGQYESVSHSDIYCYMTRTDILPSWAIPRLPVTWASSFYLDDQMPTE